MLLRRLLLFIFIPILSLATISIQFSEAVESDDIEICYIDQESTSGCEKTHDSDNDYEMSTQVAIILLKGLLPVRKLVSKANLTPVSPNDLYQLLLERSLSRPPNFFSI